MTTEYYVTRVANGVSPYRVLDEMMISEVNWRAFLSTPKPQKGRLGRPAADPMTTKGADIVKRTMGHNDIDPETVPVFKPTWQNMRRESYDRVLRHTHRLSRNR